MHEIPEEDRRLLVVIAGHNGAGKTTIYDERISDALAGLLTEHLNPDEIEKAITLDLGERSHSKEEFEELAAKEVARLRQQYLDQEKNFSFETVLSDPKQDKVGFMDEARRRGFGAAYCRRARFNRIVQGARGHPVRQGRTQCPRGQD